MSQTVGTALVRAVSDAAVAWTGGAEDMGPLMALVGDARFVLLGEASHGTHEFYKERARITRRLIEEKGFCAVAVEADWPDAWRVSRYVRGEGEDADAAEALADFRRFPTWMWRNADVLDFVGWLRTHNDAIPRREARVGFYGLDLYSLHTSMSAIVGYLQTVDPDAARRAQARYACFDHFGEDAQSYGWAAESGLGDCEDEVLSQLVDLQRRRSEILSRDGHVAEDEYFFAAENARLVRDAEAYYRSMFRGRVASWNLRDRHMAGTLERLVAHLAVRVANPRIVVWAHNSHLGDARATEMGDIGELNLGQLCRETWGGDVVNVGFTTHEGTVTAATDWGGPAERKRVRPALATSYERLFHDTGIPRFVLRLRDAGNALAELAERRLERAIGVIYRPETERVSHWFEASLPAQFDAVVHVDSSRAVEPLERNPEWETREPPETWPTGL